MKKTLLKTTTAVLFNCLVGAIIASLLGFAPIYGAVAANGVAILAGATPQVSGVLRVGVLTEVWTGEMVKALRAGMEATFLDGIPDQSSIAENDVIHLVDVGIDPEVLINNTTYPIPLQALDDKDIAVKLDKFQTKVTPIKDDELYALSYDKMARVKESHSYAISDSKFTKAAHALTPQQNTATTPVLKTTGDYENGTTGRRRLRREDIVELKKAMDNLGVPADGRRLVLCTDHVNDLLLTDQKFAQQYYDYTSGKISNLYGFEVYSFAKCPLFTKTGTKKAVGATAEAGEYQGSFAFYKQRVFKATGSTTMYFSEAKTNPEYQRSLVSFKHHFICMPKKADACVAIYSEHKA